MAQTAYVTALLREREFYKRRGLPDRAAQVTAELERVGYKDEETAEAPDAAPETTAMQPPPETATPPRPRPRRSPTDAQE